MTAKTESRESDSMMLFARVTGWIFIVGMLLTPMISTEKGEPFAGAQIIADAITTIAFIAAVVTVMKMKAQ